MRQRFGGAGRVEAESRHGEQPAKAEGRRRPAAEAAAASEGARRRPHAAAGDAGRAAAVAPRCVAAAGRHVVAGRGDSLRGQRAGSGGSTDSASRGGNGGPGGEGEGAVESWEGHPVQLSMTLDVRWAWTVGRRWNSLHDGNIMIDSAISGNLIAIYSVGRLPSIWRCDDARCTQHGAQVNADQTMYQRSRLRSKGQMTERRRGHGRLCTGSFAGPAKGTDQSRSPGGFFPGRWRHGLWLAGRDAISGAGAWLCNLVMNLLWADQKYTRASDSTNDQFETELHFARHGYNYVLLRAGDFWKDGHGSAEIPFPLFILLPLLRVQCRRGLYGS